MSITRLDVLVQAAEAYPALERAFLSAEREIWVGHRIFDLATILRAPEARSVGTDWFDLVVHTLDRGVDIHLVVSDFDPIGAVDLHRICWRTCRQAAGAAEAARGTGRLHFTAALHDARMGPVPRTVFFPLVMRRLARIVARINALSAPDRALFLADTPGLRWLTRRRGDKLSVRASFPNLWPASHHQKLAVFDRRRLFIGGLDLNERRYDGADHDRPADQTWQDIQCVVEGDVVAAAQSHLETFREVVADRRAPAPPAPGFLRTLSARSDGPFAMAPRTVSRELDAWHLEAVSAARRFIYLETQFMRDLVLARALAARARRTPELKLILVLPAAQEDVAFHDKRDRAVRYGDWQQARALRRLRQGFGPDRLLVASPVQRIRANGGSGDRAALHGAPIIYVHTKVSVFDDDRAALSSANLNGRSLRWDTEAGIALTHPDHVRQLRDRCMAHWLPAGAGPAYLSPETAFPHWHRLVTDNRRRRPEDRQGFLVPHDPRPAAAFGDPLPGVPPEAV